MKRQANTLSAIISNFDIVEDAIEASENSAGSALEENAKVLDSIQGRINLFNNAVEVMWNNLLDDEWIKLLVDGGTELVKLIDKLGSFRTILFSILTYYSVFKKDKIDLASLFGIQDGKDNNYQWTVGQKGLTGWVADTAKTAKDKIGKRKTQKTNVVTEILGDPEAEVKDFAQAIRDNIDDYVNINTTKIDTEIEDVKNKLMLARQQLDEAKASDRDYYKAWGSQAPSHDRDNRIAEQQQQVANLEQELARLEATKKQSLDDVATATVANINQIHQQKQSYQSFLGILSEVQNKILEMPDDVGAVKILDDFNAASREGQASLLNYVSTLNDAPEAVQAYLASLNGAEATLPGLINYVNQHNASVKASGVAAKVAAVGHAALNAAISMGISVLISWVVSAVTKAINANKELAESVDEAMMAYKNATKTLSDHLETLEDIEEDYAKLADGVDNLGRNISLSSEEYKRYNEITNKIADMFPEMVSGYTKEGNAIIALKGNVDALKDAYEAEAKAARDAILIQQNDVFDNFKNNTNKQTWNWLQIGKLSQNDKLSFFDTLLNGGTIDDWVEKNGYLDPAVIDGWLEEAGINSTNWFSSNTEFEEAVQENIKSVQAYYRTLIATMQAEATSVRTILNTYLEQDDNYSELTDEGKNIAQSIIAGFDTEFYGQFDSATEMEAWVLTNVVQPLQDANILDKFNIAFNIQTQFNNGQVSIDDYISEITMFVEMLSALGVDDEIIKTVVGVFEVEGYETKKNSAMDLLDTAGDANVGTLSKEDLDIIDKNKTKWQEELKLDGKVEMSWDELLAKLQEAKEALWSASVEFEKLSEAIDGVQSAYTTLSDAITQYNQDGYLTLDNLQALLSLEPEYLSALQMENGQLSLNQSVLEGIIQTKLDAAKATAVESAITQLNALAARTEADAVAGSANAANNALTPLGNLSSYLGTLTEQYLMGAGAATAFANAVQGAQDNALVTEADIAQIFTNLETQLQLIDSVGANLSTNFKTVVGGGTSGGESTLDKLSKKYERILTNLENQQTEIENKMEILEAKGQGVSYSYYEALATREQQKIGLYQRQLNELKKLELTDEVAEEIWAVEHAIQESTLAIINYRKEIVGLFTDAFDELSSVYDNEINIADNKKAYLEGYAELLELNDELPTVGLYEEMIARTEDSLQANFDKFTSLDAQAKALREFLNPFKEGTEEYEAFNKERNKELVRMQAESAAAKLAYQEDEKEVAQITQKIEDLYITAWDKVREAFNNKGSLFENQLSYIDEYINALETMNINVPDAAYQSQIDVQKLLHDNTAADLEQARSELETLRTRLGEDDEQYIEKLLEVTELEIKERQDYNKILELEQQIIDNQLERFNQVIDRINHATSTLQNISDLIADEDVATEDGIWTDEGLTRLGLAVQQMEMNKQTADEYAQKIQDLNKLYKNGQISEKKYTEELQNLEDGQWDAIKAYEDAKDAIADIHEARVDMIEEGINKEIEAYQDLIEVTKEELDAQRDLYDFKKNTQKQTKNISQLERRIASLSGSDNAADIAERKRLEAELYGAKEELNDTYYSHAKDQQQQALDEEMEAFEESKNNYVEKLRESLKDTELLVQQTYTSVLDNGQTVLQTLDTLASEYNVTIDPKLRTPWINAKGDADVFKNAVTTHIGAIKQLVEDITSPLIAKLTDPYKKAKDESVLFGTKAKETIDGVLKYATDQQTAMKNALSKPWEDAKLAVDQYKSYATEANDALVGDAKTKAAAIAKAFEDAYNTSSYGGSGNGGGNEGNSGNLAPLVVDQTANVKALQEVLNTVFGTNITVDGKFGTKTKMALMAAQSKMGITADGIYGTKTYQAILAYIDKAIEAARKFSSSAAGQGVRALQAARKKVPATLYAKGTTGTTQDQWAITDEPWLGDELTMYATKQGTLSYMRAGSTVIPADLTKELMAIGEIGLDGLTNMPKFDSGINMISSVVNKPELNLSFDALVKADKITEDTLPEVKKFVAQELDNFARKLNYSLKKVGAY